jgi:hypothetical protein
LVQKQSPRTFAPIIHAGYADGWIYLPMAVAKSGGDLLDRSNTEIEHCSRVLWSM